MTNKEKVDRTITLRIADDNFESGVLVHGMTLAQRRRTNALFASINGIHGNRIVSI